jgi:hypothetical protein
MILWYSLMSASAFCLAFHGGSSWLTAVRQIGGIPIVIFEVFHLSSHSAGTTAGFALDVMKLVFAAELLFFTTILDTAHWRNGTSFAVVLSQWIMDKYWCAGGGPLFQIFRKHVEL